MKLFRRWRRPRVYLNFRVVIAVHHSKNLFDTQVKLSDGDTGDANVSSCLRVTGTLDASSCSSCSRNETLSSWTTYAQTHRCTYVWVYALRRITAPWPRSISLLPGRWSPRFSDQTSGICDEVSTRLVHARTANVFGIHTRCTKVSREIDDTHFSCLEFIVRFIVIFFNDFFVLVVTTFATAAT